VGGGEVWYKSLKNSEDGQNRGGKKVDPKRIQSTNLLLKRGKTEEGKKWKSIWFRLERNLPKAFFL
jgi:hypothetical protein